MVLIKRTNRPIWLIERIIVIQKSWIIPDEMITLEIVLYSKRLVYRTMKINGYKIFYICVEFHMGRWYANLKQDTFNEKHYRPVRTWKLDGKQNRQTIWINNEKILYKGNIIFLFKDRNIYNGCFTKHAFAIFHLNAFKNTMFFFMNFFNSIIITYMK